MIDGENPWDDLFVDYCHPNHAGQEIVAQAVYREVVAQARGRLGTLKATGTPKTDLSARKEAAHRA